MKLLAIAVLLFLVGTAKADTGYELQQNCASDQAALGSYCLGYLRGVFDSYATWKSGFKKDPYHAGIDVVAAMKNTWAPANFCSPANMTLGQARQIVAKYFSDNPKELHLPADYLVVSALLEAFPCPPAQ